MQHKMICDHVDPIKRAKHPYPLGVPITYMELQDTFKAIKTSEYDLSHFYQLGTSGVFPAFPEPQEPTMGDDVPCLLQKAHKLVVALSQDAVTVIALLCKLHNHNSLQWLKMQTDKEAGDNPSQRLSFCPFCQHSGSNDQSYLNHIMCRHYCVNYGCSKCLDTIFTSGQKLSKHMKKCNGLLKDEAKEKPPPVM